jgi:SAM-dependent methyltransferase
VGYAEWHGEPGYFRDVTGHFRADAAVLDVGCGTAWLANHFPNYTGIDGSPEMVAAAREAGRDVIQANVGEGLPFEAERFDGVILKDLLEHVEDPMLVTREALRVLKPGGTAFASAPDAQRWVWEDYTHRRPFTRRSFRLLFEDAGFQVERVGYESVLKGSEAISSLAGRNRRPFPLRVLAHVPFLRRNVWLLARRP